jgi:hypothetical protein
MNIAVTRNTQPADTRNRQIVDDALVAFEGRVGGPERATMGDEASMTTRMVMN